MVSALMIALAGPVAVPGVTAAQEPGPPGFHVGLDYDGIGGDRWPAGIDLTVTADDPATAENPDVVLSLATDAEGKFSGFEVLPGVEPGWYVTVTDGATLKTHTVRDVSITDVDPATEIARGTADPFSTVWCNLSSAGDAAGYFVEPNASGEWLCDFSADYDITLGSQVNVLEIDEDWDSTFVFWQVPRPNGWLHNPATGHDYLYVGDGVSWTDAEEYAHSLGGHLVTINDAVESGWLIGTFGTDYWIGLNDRAFEGHWVWSSGEPVTFTDWLAGEPNDLSGEDAAVVVNKPPIGWNDLPDDLAKPFVIEIGPTTLDGLLDGMIADGRLTDGLASSIMKQAEKAPLRALTNHLNDLVRRGVITQLTMDQVLVMVTE
jgi:hypothetical protein